jgi:hypothetical protein
VSRSTGVLEAVERIVNRGGDADEVLRAVLAAFHERGVAYAVVRFVERGELVDGPRVGEPTKSVGVPVHYRGGRIGELAAAVDDPALLERVATLIAPYVLVGWDTGGEEWAP